MKNPSKQQQAQLTPDGGRDLRIAILSSSIDGGLSEPHRKRASQLVESVVTERDRLKTLNAELLAALKRVSALGFQEFASYSDIELRDDIEKLIAKAEGR